MRMTALAALFACLTLAGCANMPPPPGVSMQPMPQRAVGIVGVALASVLHAFSDEGKPSVAPIRAEAMQDGTVTWLGHSSFVIAAGGTIVLTDPIQSNRMGLLFSPERVTASPDISALTRLDAILISHVDHDHLDLPTLKKLAARFPDATLIMPADSGVRRTRLGFRNIREINSWQTLELGGMTVTSTPAHHYGQRDLLNLKESAALGYGIKGGGHRIYFAGDTAYGGNFATVRRRLGRFTTAIVPIGAWKPPEVFNNVHTTPEQAMQIATEVGASAAIAAHWGTFALGPDTPGESVRRFLAASRKTTRPVVLSVGQSWRPGSAKFTPDPNTTVAAR